MKAEEYKKYYESRQFQETYLYDGDDLGAVCGPRGTTFKLWSPLAERVALNLYQDGEGLLQESVAMQKKEKGVWEYADSRNCHGIYYDYTVTVDGRVNRTADPYAKACGCNGLRSMAVDLRKTNPAGWEHDLRPAKTTEQVIYEIHVKDFSYDPASGVPKAYRGKYKAFTIEGTTLNGAGKQPTCLDYLKRLGVTHVQLMPVFDFGSVDEAGGIQEYNWGYDPMNYNVPEGSYATDPFHGEVRIRELKELVMALHKNGIRVIMDVVYNHTYRLDSWFSRTVPHYFYRQFADGTYSDGSACGNDLASERKMCRKYILESVLYWAAEYHMDGFRFDLMGLMDTELMNEIREALDVRFGKDEIVLYGEPWQAADTAMEEGYRPCLSENMQYLNSRVGVFCDATRDAVKGHVFDADVPGFVNGGRDCEQDILHAACAWTDGGRMFRAKSPSQVVSYLSAHDNLTLWDKLVATLGPKSSYTARSEQVVQAGKMAAAVYFTCQGRIFFLGGEEAARTKQGDKNSYCSAPEINQIDWKRVYEYEDLLSYYRGLIAFRKRLPGLYDKSPDAGKRIQGGRIIAEGVVQFCVQNQSDAESCFCVQNRPEAVAEIDLCKQNQLGATGCSENCEWNYQEPDSEVSWDVLSVWYNASQKEHSFFLPDGKWELLIDDSSAWLWQRPAVVHGEQQIPPVSVRVFGRRSGV